MSGFLTRMGTGRHVELIKTEGKASMIVRDISLGHPPDGTADD
jgi:hypothetical protein